MVCGRRAGEAMSLPGCRRRRFVALIQLSLGRLLLSRACFCFTGQIGAFPISVSLGVYRAGNGKGQVELITVGVAGEFSLLSQFVQGRQQSLAVRMAQSLRNCCTEKTVPGVGPRRGARVLAA